jgi:hypothetical protein
MQHWYFDQFLFCASKSFPLPFCLQMEKTLNTVWCQKIDEAPTKNLSMHELESWLAKCIDLAAAHDCVGILMVMPHKPWSALCTLCYDKLNSFSQLAQFTAATPTGQMNKCVAEAA